MPSNLKYSDLKEIRILPRNGCFYAEFVYSVEEINVELDFDKVLGIDPGLNNWLTCVSNTGTSFINDKQKWICKVEAIKLEGFE